ncbi:PREDICTED: XK-related protein 4-like [Branchiostoma belcheri]|uniref:XK-related protein n=1 Tax=Branchiostoma belcheri TaxID=7741 RepID=A0A6P4YP20_BRABE|nr:PREDICTED: XK-related protein 4-like [Branchiostoma belcheri]
MQNTRGCFASVWDSLPRKILFYVVVPLGLYLFDVTTDLSLAVQYYNSGDFTWFGLTLGFVLGPSIIINIFSLLISGNVKDSKLMSFKVLLAILQLGVFPVYLNILYLLVKGNDVDKHIVISLPAVHLLEGMLESVPQLCLQLYILLLTGEQVSVLKVITMVASLLAAVKAVVTGLYYFVIKALDMTCSCGFVTRLILLTVWKVVELSVRVLAIGLFASAFQPWIALPIGVHWLVMTVTIICIDKNAIVFLGIGAALLMAVDTFSITFSMAHNRTFWLSTVLTLLGNITMVTVWYTLKAGQDWYDVPALVGVLVGSVVSAGLGFILMVLRGKIRPPFTCCCDKSPEEQDSRAPDPEEQDSRAPDPEEQDSRAPDPEEQDSRAPDPEEQDLLAPSPRTYMEFETNV